jgi:uncharacterized protein
MDASEIIDLLGLTAHPEGGWYRESWRSDPMAGSEPSARSAGTAIYFLLLEGERSHWHRVDAAETWHHYDGAALDLWLSADGVEIDRRALGTDLVAGQRPQVVVPPGVWQAATTSGSYTLVGCTVVPGFRFDGFELAPPGWEPGAG